MKTTKEIIVCAANLENFEPCSQGAFPTGRLIQGADSAMDPQEWAERGTIDGVPVCIYYLFSEEEASSKDIENYFWGEEYVDRIVIED